MVQGSTVSSLINYLTVDPSPKASDFAGQQLDVDNLIQSMSSRGFDATNAGFGFTAYNQGTMTQAP